MFCNQKVKMQDLSSLLKSSPSIFVVGEKAKTFWTLGIDAYAFAQGALLSLRPEDELRFPELFFDSVDGELVEIETPSWFVLAWDRHLMGIVEHKPFNFQLPDYAMQSSMMVSV